MTDTPPPPGSPAAYARGCTCRVIGNWETGLYLVVDLDCLLHTEPKEKHRP